jgi:hypothetical protein
VSPMPECPQQRESLCPKELPMIAESRGGKQPGDENREPGVWKTCQSRGQELDVYKRRCHKKLDIAIPISSAPAGSGTEVIAVSGAV